MLLSINVSGFEKRAKALRSSVSRSVGHDIGSIYSPKYEEFFTENENYDDSGVGDSSADPR